jgi:large subunit ribosomal protein L33
MGKIKENMAKMKCSGCKNINYYTKRNKKKVKEKLQMSRYCKVERRHTVHAEAK